MAANTDRRSSVYLAVSAQGGGNVYANGWTCRECDDPYDPHHRAGVPCRAAYWHAAHTVDTWNTAGGGARLEVVQVTAARAAISPPAERPHSHTPGEDGYDTRTKWDGLNRQSLLICNGCETTIGIVCG